MPDVKKLCDVCKKPLEKKKEMEWLTGPDQLHGGDGLPDWMQFTITGGMFAILYWVLYWEYHSRSNTHFGEFCTKFSLNVSILVIK